MGARETALNVLIACRKDGAWSNSVLKTYTLRDGLDRREAALASRLCYGVLQNRGKLDFYLKQLLTGKLKDLNPVIHDILHLGLYQLFEMDKIPDSAAVNESVTLAKKYCRKQRFAPGLVNAVLRGAIRQKDALKQPSKLEDRYSHPEKLVRLLRENLGDKLETMLNANNEAPDMVIQTNTLKITTAALTQRLEEEGVCVKNHPWMEDCLVLADTGRLEQLPAFREGLFYVQDAAAKLSVLCAQLPKGANVLDCCAAPGGKSFAATIAMGGTGHITSCDVHEHKINLIDGGAKRLGFQNITAGVQDASLCREDWLGRMDAVIADVPCSGYGIIRKKPDIRLKDPDTMLELPQLQLSILKNQSRYVKPGGVLLYSTCTVLKRENEDVVEAFLKENKDFTREKLNLPDVFPENTDGMLTLVPGEYDTDGFFICRMRRNG
jgi:16S rRNA (cytosine967-C5)-methyltransferase